MTVVTDSGPLIALAKIDAISILPNTYERVLMPTAVYEEAVLDARTRRHADALAIRAAVRKQEMLVVPVVDEDLPAEIVMAPVDRGEKQAIFLALRERAGMVLVDDGMARSHAREHGLVVHGTLGVILDAVKAEVLSIEDAAFLIGSIQERDDIWIADIHCRRVLDVLRQP